MKAINAEGGLSGGENEEKCVNGAMLRCGPAAITTVQRPEEQNLLRATTGLHSENCSFFFASIINQSRPYDSSVFLRSGSPKAKWCFVR